MAADKKLNGAKVAGKKPGEKAPGKKHYNPVNMSGREAGIVEEIEDEKADEQERDDASKPRTPSQPGQKR